MSIRDAYRSPLTERYASAEMCRIFSAQFRSEIFRRLWVALAEAQRELGLQISAAQIEAMRANITNIDHDYIAQKEREIRHDIMAHIHAFGEVAAEARAVIHLGATSAYIGDNADLIQTREALRIVEKRLLNAMAALASFAEARKGLPTLGFTHYQPAQPTTVGKRACLWIHDLLMDWHDLQYRLNDFAFRGAKGATGTQASFLKLFEGDGEKVARLDRLVAEKMGFQRTFPVTGQTYPRKLDAQTAALLSGIAQSASKFSGDIRLLQNLKEIEEPFGAKQVGSSAMPYKRNPMRSERIGSLSRYILTAAQSPAATAASQWFERTLDDSANKRIVMPEMFLAADAVLILVQNAARGLVVHEKMIEKRLREELPFMAAENILMEAVKQGGDRQELHERLREAAQEAGRRVKQGEENDLLERIASDKAFGLDRAALEAALDPYAYIGRAEEQTEAFLSEHIRPILESRADDLDQGEELRV